VTADFLQSGVKKLLRKKKNESRGPCGSAKQVRLSKKMEENLLCGSKMAAGFGSLEFG